MMRTFLDEGAITFEGDFFKYNGLYTFARPVQDRIPIKMGAMKGPRSFQTAGELADGVHQALAYSREAYDYMAEKTPRAAPRRPAATSDDLDIGAWVVTVVSEDSRGGQARGAHPRRVLHLLDAARAARAPRDRRLRAAAGGRRARRGRHPEGGRACSSPSTPRSSRSPGTPEEVVEKIKSDIEPAGRQPHDPRARRPRAREAVRGRGRRRTCPTSTASCGSSPSG